MPKPPKRLAPLSWRLAPEDRQRLERDAAGMSLGAYIHWRVFDPKSPPPRHRGKTPVKDHKLLSEAIARFGQSRISANLNQLAKAANSGSLIMVPELEAELQEALIYVAELRKLFIEALGLAEEAS